MFIARIPVTWRNALILAWRLVLFRAKNLKILKNVSGVQERDQAASAMAEKLAMNIAVVPTIWKFA